MASNNKKCAGFVSARAKVSRPSDGGERRRHLTLLVRLSVRLSARARLPHSSSSGSFRLFVRVFIFVLVFIRHHSRGQTKREVFTAAVARTASQPARSNNGCSEG